MTRHFLQLSLFGHVETLNLVAVRDAVETTELELRHNNSSFIAAITNNTEDGDASW